MKYFLLTFLFLGYQNIFAQNERDFIRKNYNKTEAVIPMRDGIKLYTVIYSPKDQSITYPFLLERTPYSAGPYDTNYTYRLASSSLTKEKYIFVFQDVRGRYMSEGINIEVTPFIQNKKNKKQVDESSDTWDTVEWLLKNIKNNNGRVGIYGISYPGFYATASLPQIHPAVKAVSPQAPITDEFIGDDVNHNGAFFLMDNFFFINYFGKNQAAPVKDYGSNIFKISTADAYRFFLNMGSIRNTQSANYFNNTSRIWNEYVEHDTYDDYWKSRNIRQYLTNISIPVLVVGGWFDAENLFGALQTYATIKEQNNINNTKLVMGPWTHGAWAGTDFNRFAAHNFNQNTARFFQDSIETVFFNYYLKDKGNCIFPEALIFELGTNEWKKFNSWPPDNTKNTEWHFSNNHQLSNTAPEKKDYYEYISDPQKPVPYTAGIYSRRNNEYMAEDQRFAFSRPDVLSLESNTITEDITICGKIKAELKVNIDATDADFIVKVIDVFPDTAKGFYKNAPMAGYQQLIRAEVIRGKFRNSFEKPQPFIPNQDDHVTLTLNDVAYTIKAGHKIMVQIQSSWFPLVDRNPQRFMKIPLAADTDFRKAAIRFLYGGNDGSKLILPVLK